MFIGSLANSSAAPLPADAPVRGWTILSDNMPNAHAAIRAARAYDINHLQISHRLVHNLREIKNGERCARVNDLIDAAHAAGIAEVVLWDHALYKLDYYPQKFRTGPDGTIDFDNPEFWEWFKADYRVMLDLVPKADGIILTFIETGARAERQHSLKLKTRQEKLAAVVNAVGDVVIGERGMSLYARTFAYTDSEYATITGAINYFSHPEVRLMMKEVPHDFFLTHPNNRFVGMIARPTIVEFDAAAEYNGQGIIANTWPRYMLQRWRDFANRPNVIGYTARTDRYKEATIIGRPSEINLHALKRACEIPDITDEQIYDEFITARYGAAALSDVKSAFRKAFDIITCSLYTLGTTHSMRASPDYTEQAPTYTRHVSGKWLKPPVAYVGHGVNREFHQWRDIIDRIAPPAHKTAQNRRWNETPGLLENSGWIHPDERMDEEYLRYVMTEKNHGVALATEALASIENARAKLAPADYEDLKHYFARTLLTVRLHRSCAAAYYGFRVWCRGGAHRSPYVTDTVQNGLAEMRKVAKQIRAYPVKPPVGQWNWAADAKYADRYFKWIVTDGWPATTLNVPNPNAGMKFPFKIQDK